MFLNCSQLFFAPKDASIHVKNQRMGISPAGVLPVQPVQRTWELNRDTGVKIKRQGFTLVNDFAKTVFMIQGETMQGVFYKAPKYEAVPTTVMR